MVRVLLDGRKTQTRRILKGVPEWCSPDRKPGYSCLTPPGHIEFRGYYPGDDQIEPGYGSKFVKLPALKGDRLWVKETWRTNYGLDFYDDDLGRCPKPTDMDPETTAIEYLADGERELGGKTRVSLFMRRWMSRLTLTVTDVRVERLQDCSESDAIAEGCDAAPVVMRNDYLSPPETFKAGYRKLWDQINGAGSWEANPWVVAISFDVEQRNIDA